MLSMKLIEEKGKVEALSESFRVPSEEGMCVYVAEDLNGLLGTCFFKRTETGIKIIYADANGDMGLFDGLIRSSMAVLFDSDRDEVEFSSGMDENALRTCGFIRGDEWRIESANDFFETCKNCKN